MGAKITRAQEVLGKKLIEHFEAVFPSGELAHDIQEVKRRITKLGLLTRVAVGDQPKLVRGALSYLCKVGYLHYTNLSSWALTELAQNWQKARAECVELEEASDLVLVHLREARARIVELEARLEQQPDLAVEREPEHVLSELQVARVRIAELEAKMREHSEAAESIGFTDAERAVAAYLRTQGAVGTKSAVMPDVVRMALDPDNTNPVFEEVRHPKGWGKRGGTSLSSRVTRHMVKIGILCQNQGGLYLPAEADQPAAGDEQVAELRAELATERVAREVAEARVEVVIAEALKQVEAFYVEMKSQYEQE